MKITIRQSVRPDLAAKLPMLLDRALVWMAAKYPTIDFHKSECIFSAGYSRSRYFRNEVSNGKYLAPNVCISTRATLGLYNKPSLGIKRQWVFVGSDVQIVCALIHELTHHVQYEMNERKGNELDTTANELEYLKEYHPNFYAKFLKPQRKKHTRS